MLLDDSSNVSMNEKVEGIKYGIKFIKITQWINMTQQKNQKIF